MKKAILVLVFIFVLSLLSVSQAAITTTGNVDPADPSTWTSNTTAYIGETGNGTMGITGGSDVIDKFGYVGFDDGSTGVITVDGSGSTWNNDSLYVGVSGNGTLNITDGGAVSNDDGFLGFFTGSGAATVDGPGSTWTNRGDLYVGLLGNGMLNITGGGVVSVARILTIDHFGGNDSFINMATGGMLALFGDADDSLAEFLGLIEGTDAIRYWDGSVLDWADITGAAYGIDYTLEYLTDGDLAGYTMLTVPEPGTVLFFGLGGLVLRRKR